MQIDIYTDGACTKARVGGWAYLIKRSGHQIAINSGQVLDATNNRMELSAAIFALRAPELVIISVIPRITLYSDSQYVVLGITKWLHQWTRNNWLTSAGKPVLNQDLWEKLARASQPYPVEFKWVRGHNGHLENEIVDKLAVAASRRTS